MTKPLVFLDMDGVVADFIGHIATMYGKKVSNLPPVHDLSVALGLPQEQIDAELKSVSNRFWSSVPVLPWASVIVGHLAAFGDLYILSRPWTGDPFCAFHKINWCWTNLGIPMERVILTGEKHLLSAPGRYLIDDYSPNCDAWVKAGGHAILFPARHNEWMGLAEPSQQPIPAHVSRYLTQMILL